LQREFFLARSQPRHLAPQPNARAMSPRAGVDGVADALLFAQHAIEMFRRSLPDGPPRRCLDRLSNRLTKILSEARKLKPRWITGRDWPDKRASRRSGWLSRPISSIGTEKRARHALGLSKDSVLAIVTRGRMAKVTSKFQVTVPKSIADRYRIRPGDEIEWIPAGDAIRVVPGRPQMPSEDAAARVQLFDQATERHRMWPARRKQPSGDRGWTREDLYGRGRSR